jgi:hypothetical protein
MLLRESFWGRGRCPKFQRPCPDNVRKSSATTNKKCSQKVRTTGRSAVSVRTFWTTMTGGRPSILPRVGPLSLALAPAARAVWTLPSPLTLGGLLSVLAPAVGSLSPGTPGRSQGILRAPERLLAAGPPSRRGQNAPLPSICPLWGPACPRGHLARDAGARSVPWSEGYGLPPGRCSAPQFRSHGQHTLTGGLRARPGGRQAP